MTNKIQQALTGGIIGTAAMTLITMMAPMMGLPKMSPPQMLSMMLGTPIVIGWIMHFMIGITFALIYSFYLNNWLNIISNKFLKGTVFGVLVFIFAQIMMAIMGNMMGGMPAMEGSMMLNMMGSLIGHVIFGIVVALLIKGSAVQKLVA